MLVFPVVHSTLRFNSYLIYVFIIFLWLTPVCLQTISGQLKSFTCNILSLPFSFYHYVYHVPRAIPEQMTKNKSYTDFTDVESLQHISIHLDWATKSGSNLLQPDQRANCLSCACLWFSSSPRPRLNRKQRLWAFVLHLEEALLWFQSVRWVTVDPLLFCQFYFSTCILTSR